MGQCFCGTLQNLCFSSFRLLFQCLTHTEKALKDFLPVTQARHGAGRVIRTNLDYCQSLYISFIFAVLIIANLFSITANNLIYDAEEKNGLFAATSATRVIIFAVRISFLIRSQWDIDRQPYSWKRQPRFDCALFSVPFALLCVGRLLVSCFHCVYYYLLFLIALQRYKLICNRPNILPKIFVFLTFYNK